MPSNSPLWKEQVQILTKLRDVITEHWLKYNVFSVVWWLMIILIVLLWVLWWKKVDRNRLHELVTYGLMVSLIAIVIDVIGVNLVLWGYPNRLTPFGSPLIVTDFCIFPVSYMLLYQRYSYWRDFLIATVILAFFIAFVAENVAVALDIYKLINWKHLYDFPLYILLAISLKWIMSKLIP